MTPDSKDLVDAINKLGERLITAEDAQLAHLREINGTLTGIMTHLGRIADVLSEWKDKEGK